MHAYDDKTGPDIQSSATNTTAANNIATYFSIEVLGANYYKLTPVVGDNGTTNIAAVSPAISYIRFSFVGTGENMAITLNEPIE
jgi:hypothetical protein